MSQFYALLSAAVLAAILAVANIYLKLSADAGGESIVNTYTQNIGKLFIALVLYASVFLIYPILLKYFPLNVIFPVYTGLTIIFVTIAGAMMFDEKILINQYIGIALLFVGVLFISKSTS